METNKVTELVLENIEKLLLEGRVENLKKKYPKPNWEDIDKLVDADPSKTNKFLEWAAKHMLPNTIKWFKENANGGGYYSWDLEIVPDVADSDAWENNYRLSRNIGRVNDSKVRELKDNLEHYFKNPSKYEIKDINQFQNMKEFEDAVEVAKQKLSRKEMKETGVDKVFEDDRFILLMPKTHKASCRYGARTRWCVTMRDYSGYFENYFSQGPIFFLIDKSQPARSWTPSYMQDAENYWKVAIHYRPFNGRLDQRGDRALQYARQMNKEEFVDGGDIDSSHIDYWNVADDNKRESVVAKFLGGPGRGQKQRADVILNQLKGVMETYTKRALASYYDSLGNDTDVVDQINEIDQKMNEIGNQKRQVNYRRQRMSNVVSSLRNLQDYARSDEDEEENKYEVWTDEQLQKARELYQELNEAVDKYDDEIQDLRSERDKLEEKLEDKRLAFYDKERNVPMNR